MQCRRGGTAAAMAQNDEQTTEEHSTLEQQSPGRLDHPAWSVVYSIDRQKVTDIGSESWNGKQLHAYKKPVL